MKKIMFNDHYGLTQAVLDGRKTMTRRIIKLDELGEYNLANALKQDWGEVSIQAFIKNSARYQVGEIVAIAQSYRDIWQHTGYMTEIEAKRLAGYSNKMFVRADLMPHQIRFNNRKVERLQDISDEDCLKEGVYADIDPMNPYVFIYTYPNSPQWFFSAREAFASLIDKVSGKGTWDSNPFVFAYSFGLVK